MFFYGLYLLGAAACLFFPRTFSYWVAGGLADFSWWRSPKDRAAVRGNLLALLGTQEVSQAQVRSVFRNFGMYLVDFFRYSHLTREKIQQLVRIEGLEHMKAALAGGRGAIGLTAHLGNFELAGAVLSLLGLPVNAVVLTHRNRRVDAFFTAQRARVGVKGIPVQRLGARAFFEMALAALGRNEILALVGDRDFFDRGFELPFCGKTLRVPRGPASFSIRTGAPIVPGFLVRESDGGYRFFLEPPITAPAGMGPEEGERFLTKACLDVMATYIRRYPEQWYMFQEFWRPGPAIIL